MRSARPLPTHRPTRLGVDAVVAVAGALTALVLVFWLREGGAGQFADGVAGVATGTTQLTGLFASFAGLAGLVLAGRPVALERRYGLDRLFIWHRILGETMAVLVGVHVAAGILAWATDDVLGYSFGGSVLALTGREPYMAMATVGALLIGAVTVSSLRSIRRRLAYETWYFLHLLAYVGFAISFSHEIVIGSTFSDHTFARWLWIGLHIAIGVLLVRGRWGKAIAAARRPLELVARRPLNDHTVELEFSGGALAQRHGDAGQFVLVRPLVPRLWWQAHPFSLSAAPTHGAMTVSVKALGDASAAITRLPIGTKFGIEGPYGACRPDVIGDRKVLFVVGGIGVAPVKALLERLGPDHEPIVLYRASNERDLVYTKDLDALTSRLGGRLMTLVGPTATLAHRDPFGANVLRSAIPDVADRVAVLCGPERLLWAARAGLKDAGMATADIHFEEPWW